MDFHPHHPIVKLCLQGMAMEEKGEIKKANELFTQAWKEAGNDFEKFLAAWYRSRHQQTVADELHWLETVLALAQKLNNPAVNPVLPILHNRMAGCYQQLGNAEKATQEMELASVVLQPPTDKGPFFHGTKAVLQTGDMLKPGNQSNYQADLAMNHIYFTALPHGAGLAAALAKGDGQEHVYIVEPTAAFENDPNVTNKKFPGNPTRSYRSLSPLKIMGELNDWKKITDEELQHWRNRLADNKGAIIN